MRWINIGIIIYLIIISVLAIVMTAADKQSAKKHKKRVPENSLMLISLLGGGIGMYITMLLIRHKTKHKKFMIGLPIIIICEGIIFGLLIYFFH